MPTPKQPRRPHGRPALDPTRQAVRMCLTLSPEMAQALEKFDNKSEVVRLALAAWLKKEWRKG